MCILPLKRIVGPTIDLISGTYNYVRGGSTHLWYFRNTPGVP